MVGFWQYIRKYVHVNVRLFPEYDNVNIRTFKKYDYLKWELFGFDS